MARNTRPPDRTTCTLESGASAIASMCRPQANSASQSLDSGLSRLRKVFRDAGAGDLLATEHPGYVLHAPDIDALRFEALVREAREALRTADPATAAARLSEALSLWRGQAYAEVADEDWARAEVSRLAELRLAAAEDRIDAKLALAPPSLTVIPIGSNPDATRPGRADPGGARRPGRHRTRGRGRTSWRRPHLVSPVATPGRAVSVEEVELELLRAENDRLSEALKEMAGGVDVAPGKATLGLFGPVPARVS